MAEASQGWIEKSATKKLSELITRYDYVLLDINRNIEVTPQNAELVAIILDSDCSMSVDSAAKFIVDLRSFRCKKAPPAYFGLVTQCDIGGVSRELVEFLGDAQGVSEEEREKLWIAKRGHYLRREHILKQIRSLDFPLLATQMTSAHKIAIEIYNYDRPFMDGYCYFHSLLDIAPDSPAADEICRLTEELVNCRM